MRWAKLKKRRLGLSVAETPGVTEAVLNGKVSVLCIYAQTKESCLSVAILLVSQENIRTLMVMRNLIAQMLEIILYTQHCADQRGDKQILSLGYRWPDGIQWNKGVSTDGLTYDEVSGRLGKSPRTKISRHNQTEQR